VYILTCFNSLSDVEEPVPLSPVPIYEDPDAAAGEMRMLSKGKRKAGLDVNYPTENKSEPTTQENVAYGHV